MIIFYKLTWNCADEPKILLNFSKTGSRLWVNDCITLLIISRDDGLESFIWRNPLISKIVIFADNSVVVLKRKVVFSEFKTTDENVDDNTAFDKVDISDFTGVSPSNFDDVKASDFNDEYNFDTFKLFTVGPT